LAKMYRQSGEIYRRLDTRRFARRIRTEVMASNG
jgi:hypothetical protein